MPQFLTWLTTRNAAATLDGTEEFIGLQSSNGVKITTEQIAAYDVFTVHVADFGAVADGTSHPLSDYYGSLAAAQVVYPFATSLSQEIDYCACQAASNAAFGAAGSENGSDYYSNKPLHINAGDYRFGSDTWVIRNLGSSKIYGDGQLATRLRGSSIVLQFDGIWYSTIESMTIEATDSGAVCALDMDGNVPGHSYTTRGVQAVTLNAVSIITAGGSYCMALNRQGGSGAQGDGLVFNNVRMSGAVFACYYQSGYNALNNVFIQGDFQAYTKHGIYADVGIVNCFGTSFESTYGYTQILNDGWDIVIGNGGVFNTCCFYGCRSESMRFLYNVGSVNADIRGCTGNLALSAWAASHAYSLNDVVFVDYVGGADAGKVFRCTTAGTSGGSEPTWPQSGTQADGGVTWTFLDFNFIDNARGTVDYATCVATGKISTARYGWGQVNPVTADYTATEWDNVIFVDATSGAITVTLPTPAAIELHRKITVKKVDTSANAVTVAVEDSSSSGAQFEGGGATDTIAGGSRGFQTYCLAGEPGGASPPWWYKIGS